MEEFQCLLLHIGITVNFFVSITFWRLARRSGELTSRALMLFWRPEASRSWERLLMSMWGYVFHVIWNKPQFISLTLSLEIKPFMKHISALFPFTFTVFFILWFVYLQVSQRDILNSIDREMSGDVRAGFKCIGMWYLKPFERFIDIDEFNLWPSDVLAIWWKNDTCCDRVCEFLSQCFCVFREDLTNQFLPQKLHFPALDIGPWISAVSAQMASYTIILYVLLVIHVSKLTNASCKAHCNFDDIELPGHVCILLIKKLYFFSSAMFKKSFRILCWSIVEEHERRWHWWHYLDQSCCVSVWGRL